jgi:hypothetical protein
MIISNSFHTLYEFFEFIDHEKNVEMQCGRIMTKLAQRHNVWTSYRASYPTLVIYDEM